MSAILMWKMEKYMDRNWYLLLQLPGIELDGADSQALNPPWGLFIGMENCQTQDIQSEAANSQAPWGTFIPHL